MEDVSASKWYPSQWFYFRVSQGEAKQNDPPIQIHSQKSPLDTYPHFFCGGWYHHSIPVLKMTSIGCNKVCWIYTISVKEALLVINGNHAVQGFFLRHKHSSAPEHWFSTGCVTLQKWFVSVQFNSLKVPSLLGIKLWLNLRSKKHLSNLNNSLWERQEGLFFLFFFMKINGKKGWRSLFCVEAADHPWQPPCEDLPLRHLDEQRFRPGEEFDVENLSTDPVVKKDDICWWKKSG